MRPIEVRAVARGACRAGVVAALLLVPALAAAQSPLPAGSPGRFSMNPVEGGVLRLDTETGALSMCKQVSGSWTCSMLPDDRTAVDAELARLKKENEDLKASVKRLEELAGMPDDGKRGRAQLPTEEDIDKAMSYVQRMLKKFKEKLKELEETDPPKRT